MMDFSPVLAPGSSSLITGVPDGFEANLIVTLAKQLFNNRTENAVGPDLVFVARDGQRLAAIERAIPFHGNDISVLALPAWDCLPYDRVSPATEISAARMNSLSRLIQEGNSDNPVVLLVTVNAILQKIPSRTFMRDHAFSARPGNRIIMDNIVRWLEHNGFLRTPTVRETGEYAVRGGIVDLFASGSEYPVRLDFFGDTLESIRSFDPETQRTVGQLRNIDLVPANEVILNQDTIVRFRKNYTSALGAAGPDDLMYAAISEGRRYQGMEHWLPFFHEELETLFDYTPDAHFLFDPLFRDAIKERQVQILDHYGARKDALGMNLREAVPYKPVASDLLYLGSHEWADTALVRTRTELSAFSVPQDTRVQIDIAGKQGRNFAAERSAGNVNIFDAVIDHLSSLRKQGKKPGIACWSKGSRDRMISVLKDHGLERIVPVDSWDAYCSIKNGQTALLAIELEKGFETEDLAVVCEQDILGDRLVRTRRKSRKNSDFISEATSLSLGDLVVHIEHGIARFAGLKTLDAAGAPHDCLELHYAGGDKLFLPVENIELLSRYGSSDTEAQLDRLGGTGWQARKSKLKQRIRDMADQLIKVAAERELRTADVIVAPEGVYDEFCARFPYEETEDQLGAIESVFDDLAKGRPMDRLICGDVGFGKTEVALRAALLVALSGRQVALVVPTTLLARQHYKTFVERFSGFPIEIRQASRLVGGKELAKTKNELKEGLVDIVIGTHALLGKSVTFRDLGMIIIDEEQHFGVKHKERLKEMKSDVHVLTLTATPIPRTLQLALTGVRELSLIATPPVDRLAVRTFISPFDGLVVREALLRERYRGGQSFYVCPRVKDIANVRAFLEDNVPELKVAVAHGQMAPTLLEDIMTAFYDGQYDVLLSTTIIESGIDVPTANTLIVHRADMFGLSQLYQLRGRVGRSKIRAYALFTVPANKVLTNTAERRLKVLQSLDTLGAGFQLASHDLDIRGAGNLLGEEQSGQIREVGFELYQQMLEEAVASLKSGDFDVEAEKWSPQITIGTAVLIPEHYVKDLQLRLGLYKRLADLDDAREIDAFGAELIDRFGPLPEEVDHLLKIVYIKGLSRIANVEKIDAGPKGVVISFRNNEFPNPEALVGYLTEQGTLARIRPDQKIVLFRDWTKPVQRLKGTAVIMTQFARLAGKANK
ncbi:MAG: transcription-repair coupling factor [Cohaesibacteraceae bacterium]|nr:transcription-repair coupling factor [Cohaesibacteraceae bacterium]